MEVCISDGFAYFCWLRILFCIVACILQLPGTIAHSCALGTLLPVHTALVMAFQKYSEERSIIQCK